MEYGFDIVMTGFAGGAEAANLAVKHAEELRTRFGERYAAKMMRYTDAKAIADREDLPDEEADPADRLIYQAGSGGVYKALWDICEDHRCGLRVDIKSIPIRQETIETCNYLDEDPYMLDSPDVFVILTKAPEALISEFKEKGIEAARIGRTTKELARILLIGDNERFINRPEGGQHEPAGKYIKGDREGCES